MDHNLVDGGQHYPLSHSELGAHGELSLNGRRDWSDPRVDPDLRTESRRGVWGESSASQRNPHSDRLVIAHEGEVLPVDGNGVFDGVFVPRTPPIISFAPTSLSSQAERLDRSYLAQRQRKISGDGPEDYPIAIPDAELTLPFENMDLEPLRSAAVELALAAVTSSLVSANDSHPSFDDVISLDPELLAAGGHIVKHSVRVNAHPVIFQRSDGSFDQCCQVTGMLDLRNRLGRSIHWYVNSVGPDLNARPGVKWSDTETGLVRIGFSVRVPLGHIQLAQQEEEFDGATSAQSFQERPFDGSQGGMESSGTAMLAAETPAPPPRSGMSIAWYFLHSREAMENELAFIDRMDAGDWSLSEIVGDESQRRGCYIAYGGLCLDRDLRRGDDGMVREDLSTMNLRIVSARDDVERVLLEFSGNGRPNTYVPVVWDPSDCRVYFYGAHYDRKAAEKKLTAVRPRIISN